ncbi:MAG: response regulator [Clostridia bacterium]|nr:response regulator [Clostridia bacterium]
MKDHTILVVDDNRTNLQIIRDVLEPHYTLQLAISGEMALKFIARKKPDLILLDLMMPGMNGKECFQEIRRDPDNSRIPVIFLTASQDEDVEVECLNLGASDFITKPIVPEILERRIAKTLELEDLQKNLQGKIIEKTQEIEVLALQAIRAIVQTIEAKDELTQGHSVRVAGYSRAIAAELGFNEKMIGQVYQTALLHDVGKIGIPDSILKKKGRLTPEEYDQIKQHTTIGANILASISTIAYLEDGARYHHERYDGNGYPQRLKGDDIPIIGRIIAVADVYDALVSRRHYKEVMDDASARHELLFGAGTQFDPYLVRIFIKLLDSGAIEKIKHETELRP